MPDYSNISNSSQTGKVGGYKNAFYFVKNSDVDTWVRPVNPAVANGDTVKIITAHVLVDDKATHQWDCKRYSVTHTSEAVGDPGAQQLLHKATVVILGDNAVTLEQIKNMLNDDMTVFIKDADCINNNGYVQLGDDCNPVSISPKFDGKTNSPTASNKEYTLEITSLTKFFYTATLPAPAP
jgi:hypothetical protein